MFPLGPTNCPGGAVSARQCLRGKDSLPRSQRPRGFLDTGLPLCVLQSTPPSSVAQKARQEMAEGWRRARHGEPCSDKKATWPLPPTLGAERDKGSHGAHAQPKGASHRRSVSVCLCFRRGSAGRVRPPAWVRDQSRWSLVAGCWSLVAAAPPGARCPPPPACVGFRTKPVPLKGGRHEFCK